MRYSFVPARSLPWALALAGHAGRRAGNGTGPSDAADEEIFADPCEILSRMTPAANKGVGGSYAPGQPN